MTVEEINLIDNIHSPIKDQFSIGSDNLGVKPRRYDSFQLTRSNSRRRMFSPLAVMAQPVIDNPFDLKQKDNHSTNMGTQKKVNHPANFSNSSLTPIK